MVDVTVTSAHPLTADVVTAIKKAVTAKYGKDAQINQVVSAAAIGGLKIRIGSKEIDHTIASRLSQVEQELRKQA